MTPTRFEENQPVSLMPARASRRRHRALLRPVVAAMALALAAPTALAAPATAAPPAAGGQQQTPTSATDMPAAAAGASGGNAAPVPVNPSGLNSANYTVTLPTGDQVRLSRNGEHYTVVALPTASPTATPVVSFQTRTDAKHVTTSITAIPAEATGLVAAGLVDRQIFDVLWLIKQGDTSPAGTVPLTLEYPAKINVAAARSAADALPGTTVTGTGTHNTVTVTVKVKSTEAAAFWTGLVGGSGRTYNVLTAPSHLAGGVTGVRATGRPSAPAAAPASGEPMYTLTVVEKKTKGAKTCGVNPWTFCPGFVNVMAVNKPDGESYPILGAACVDSDPCTTVNWTFRVPAGIYQAEDNAAYFTGDNDYHGLLMVNPQFTVTGDTTIVLDADSVQPVRIQTSQPTEFYYKTPMWTRTLPGGLSAASFAQSGYGTVEFGAAPTTATVTAGAFHYSEIDMLGKPPLAMTVSSPRSLNLHATYPRYSNIEAGNRFARFDGTQSLQLVDVGFGDPADFARVDVRGKLAYVHKTFDLGPLVATSMFQNALAAGAAGILFAIKDNPWRWVPFYPDWFENRGAPVDLPFANIPTSDVTQVDAMLAAGPVSIKISDGGPTPYLYDLKLDAEGKVPASLDYRVDDQQLTKVSANYHAAKPGVVDTLSGAFRPNEQAVGGTFGSGFAAPSVLTHYFGPVSPDTVWQQDQAGESGSAAGLSVQRHVTVRTAQTDVEHWFDRPRTPAPFTPQTDVISAQPNRIWGTHFPLPVFGTCTFCRAGDAFIPYTQFTPGSDPRTLDGAYTYAADAMHMYAADGTEIPLTPQGGFDAYPLPVQQAKYRFTTSGDGVDSDWTFSSGRPAADDSPVGYWCATWLFKPSEQCHADPLILLRYNAHTDLTNSVTASSKHSIDVTPVYQQTPGKSAALTAFTLSTSVDGGKTWQQAKTSKKSDGSYTADYQVPALSATNGHVSVRVEAADAAGNTVTQTLTDVYSVSTR